jgi:tetratricopeptide (TPR) repeat protein
MNTKIRFIISIIPIIFVAFMASLTSYSSLEHNLKRVQAWHQIAPCLELNGQKAFDQIWLGLSGSQLHTCSSLPINADPDLIALASWLGGNNKVSTEVLLDLKPAWRGKVFAWRNQDWMEPPFSKSDKGSIEAASFAARVAGLTWIHGEKVQGLQIAFESLALSRHEQVADLLVRGGITPFGSEDLPAFNMLRRRIAQVMPAYAPNYVDWFETAVNFQDWDTAGEACASLQEQTDNLYKVETGLCKARLAFYRGDYASANTMLTSLSQLYPSDVRVLTWYGISEKQLGQYLDAEQIFLRAIDIEKKPEALMNLYWNLGDCQMFLGRKAEARYSYQTALRLTQNEKYIKTLRGLLENIH